MSKNSRWNNAPDQGTNNPWDKMKQDVGTRARRGRMGHVSGKMDLTYLVVLVVIVAIVIGLAALTK